MRQNVARQVLDKENSFLGSTLEKGTHLVCDLGTEFDHETEKISSLKSRIQEGRLHLAVLGQFKREKRSSGDIGRKIYGELWMMYFAKRLKRFRKI
jgi:hypothetical protein